MDPMSPQHIPAARRTDEVADSGGVLPVRLSSHGGSRVPASPGPRGRAPRTAPPRGRPRTPQRGRTRPPPWHAAGPGRPAGRPPLHEAIEIAVRDQMPRTPVRQQLREPAHRERHHRQARSHRLQRQEREALVGTGQQRQIRTGQDGGDIGAQPPPAHPISHARSLQRRPSGTGTRTVADQPQLRPGARDAGRQTPLPAGAAASPAGSSRHARPARNGLRSCRGRNRPRSTRLGRTRGAGQRPSSRTARPARSAETAVTASSASRSPRSRRRSSAPWNGRTTSVPCKVATSAGARRPIRQRRAAAQAANGRA